MIPKSVNRIIFWRVAITDDWNIQVTGTGGHKGWLASNINYGRLDLFFGLLTALSLINFVAYLLCAIWFKPQVNLKPVLEMENKMGSGSKAEERVWLVKEEEKL